MRKIILLAGALACSSATSGITVNTPSGQPEGIFENISLADAEGKVASACMDRGWSVTAQSTNQVTCQVPFGGFKQALAGALLGNAYSTPPNIFIQVSLAEVGPKIRAQARAWMETQMAFGQVRQMPFDNSKNKTELTGLLASAGATLPNGTTFTGNYLGIDNSTADTNTIHVMHVYSSGPAALAGMKHGDEIIAINGKSFKNDADFGKRLAKINDPTYTITVRRGGASTMVLNVQRASMPAVGTPAYQAIVAEKKSLTKR